MKLNRFSCYFLMILATCASSQAQTKFEVGPLRSCSAQDDARWQTLETEFGGLTAQDPDTPTVAQYSAGRFGYFGLYLFPYNWSPLSDTKQMMCGRFARFDWNQVWTNENDWNLRILPSQFFEDAFKDAVPYSTDKTQVWSCDPNPNEDPARHQCGVASGPEFGQILHNCFEAEATPRSDEFQNPWFEKNGLTNACSNIVDHSACVYGPYVTEAVHGNRPEIHPAEVLWWRNEQGTDWKSVAAQSWTLLHVQDASERFDEVSDFAPTPSDDLIDWGPWAAPKQAIDFDVSLQTPIPAAAPTQFKVNEVIGDGVVPVEAGSAPRDVLVTFSGKPLYVVSQVQHDTSHYEITRVTGVCTTADGSVRSSLRIRSTIGVMRRGGKTADLGFHAVQLWNAAASDPTPPTPQGHALLGFKPAEIKPAINLNTMKVRFENGTLQVTVRRGSSKRFGVLQEHANNAENQELDVQTLLGPDAKVAVRTRILQIRATPVQSPSASQRLAGYLGTTHTTQGVAQGLSDIVFTAAPQLTVTRNGQTAWEDSEELFSAFNRRLASSGRSGQKLLLNTSRDVADWKFEAWQCGHPEKGCPTKGPAVQVVRVKPPNSAPVVYVNADLDGDIPRFHIEFPTGPLSDTLIWLRATGPTTLDGSPSQMFDFFNVAVPVADDSDDETERIVDALATFLGVPSAKLAGGPSGDSLDPFMDNPRFRLAHMLRMQIKHAAEGSSIEPQAMALFLDQAKRLANLPVAAQ